MSELQIGELAALATALFWTFSALAWTSAGKYVGALAVSFIRLVMAAFLLLLYKRLVHGQWLPSDATLHIWFVLGISGMAGLCVCDLCLIKSFLLIGPRLSLLIFSLAPPIAAVISRIFLGDVMLVRHWIAMGVTLTGVVWVVLEQPDDAQPHDRRHRLRGVLLAATAALAHAIGYVLSKEGLGGFQDPVGATLIRVASSLPCYVIIITFWRRWPAITATVCHGRAMLILAGGALVGPFAGIIFNMVSLQYAPVGVVSTIIATMPIIIMPFSIFLYHEKISPRAFFGAVVAIAGIAMLV